MAHKILAVDDEPDVLIIIKTGLEVEGFEVITAPGGQEALVLAAEQKPDLVLLDVMMPDLDGFEVLAKLKEDDELASIPVIMLTGLTDQTKIQKALISGIHYYIVKPFDFSDLLAKVRNVLGHGSSALA